MVLMIYPTDNVTITHDHLYAYAKLFLSLDMCSAR